jgi:hypothetical protein
LRELGFDEGADVEVLHRSALGAGPVACRIGRMTVALRPVQHLHRDAGVEAQFAQPPRFGRGKARPVDGVDDGGLMPRERFEADGQGHAACIMAVRLIIN